MGFVAAQWFAACVSQQGLQEVYAGQLDRRSTHLPLLRPLTSTFSYRNGMPSISRSPGSLGEVLLLLALLDFLTLSPLGSTCSRRLTLQRRQGATRGVGHVRLSALFGAPQLEAVRATAVMRLAGDRGRLLEVLQELPAEAKEVEEAVELLGKAAVCLKEVAKGLKWRLWP